VGGSGAPCRWRAGLAAVGVGGSSARDQWCGGSAVCASSAVRPFAIRAGLSDDRLRRRNGRRSPTTPASCPLRRVDPAHTRLGSFDRGGGVVAAASTAREAQRRLRPGVCRGGRPVHLELGEPHQIEQPLASEAEVEEPEERMWSAW
jgi:hypothetical protein